jgi:thiamine biosynthesis protein ThiS
MPNPTITVTVNGAERTVEGRPSVRELLGLLDLDPRQVVVEVNREIVRRPALDTLSLADGDRVEVVHFVGGG